MRYRRIGSVHSIIVLRTPYRYLFRTYLLPHWSVAVRLAMLLGSLISLDLVQPQIVRFFIDTAQAAGALGPLWG